MARVEISDGLYKQWVQQAAAAGLSVEDWLVITTAPDLQEIYTWFFGLMGHDLRAPLAAIVTSSEILKHYQTRLTEDRRIEHLDSIQEQVYLLTVLLSNVRTLQQMAQGVLRCEPTIHDLVDFAESVCQEVRNIAHNSHELTITVVDGPTACQFDERLLRRALINVLLNAIQFSPAGTPIQLLVAITSQQASIMVMDNGLGIPAAEQERVFDLYYQASNASDHMSQGLGLTVAQGVLALHGGSINLTSAVDEGTTVHIKLPV